MGTQVTCSLMKLGWRNIDSKNFLKFLTYSYGFVLIQYAFRIFNFSFKVFLFQVRLPYSTTFLMDIYYSIKFTIEVAYFIDICHVIIKSAHRTFIRSVPVYKLIMLVSILQTETFHVYGKEKFDHEIMGEIWHIEQMHGTF